MKRSVVFFLLGCVLPLGCLGWGTEGHKIVAQVAADMLNPTASQVVGEFLGSYSMADVAPDADEYRLSSAGHWSTPCHFCNLPRGATSFTMKYCPGYCVVKSIQNYTSILAGEANQPFACNVDPTDGVEPCALMFLIHYVGDVHQPLHVSYSDDRGGNEVKVKWFGSETNLHSVWDTAIISKWDKSFTDATAELEQIMANNSSLVKQFMSDMKPVDWANESFQYVLNDVYNFDSSRSEPSLGAAYYNHNLPIVQLRLIAAGVRLATLLNSLLS